MLKYSLLGSVAIAAAAAISPAAAFAAPVVVTNSGTTPNHLPLTLTPIGGGTYTGGSTDTLTSAGNSTRNFTLYYDFSAPDNGDGSISFTTTSKAPSSALLFIKSALFNGAPVTVETVIGDNGARTYTGSFDFVGATLGDPFTLQLNGTVRRGGTLSTSLSFAAAGVPEPATWGLMILGFGAVGATLRRRSTKVAYAI